VSVHAVIDHRWQSLIVDVAAEEHERKRNFPARDTAAAGRYERCADYGRCCNGRSHRPDYRLGIELVVGHGADVVI
jgi:hypothetical protein